MQLERVLAVLERVGDADGLGRQLAGPARGHEATADLAGDRGPEDEAARLGSDDEVGRLRAPPLAELARSPGAGPRVASSGLMSLKPTPGCGKSGTSRTRARRSMATGGTHRSPNALRAPAARARREAGRAPVTPPRATGGRRARSCAARGSGTGARARRAARAGLPRGRRSCGTCAGGARRSRTAPAGRRRPRSRRRSRGRAAHPPRGAGRAARTPRAPGPARRRSRPARTALRGRARPRLSDPRRAAALALRAAAGGELLADHAQRQELVPLQPQDRLEPLDVLLAEEAVAAARALRREQPLVLEVADLRDRDVGELRAAAARRPRRSCAAAAAAPACRCASCSSAEEGQAVLADLELVVVLELRRRLDPPPVDEGAVQAAEVLDRERLAVAERSPRGCARR